MQRAHGALFLRLGRFPISDNNLRYIIGDIKGKAASALMLSWDEVVGGATWLLAGQLVDCPSFRLQSSDSEDDLRMGTRNTAVFPSVGDGVV